MAITLTRPGMRATDRAVFDGRRQRDALTALQADTGRDATSIARDVGLSYPQYNRYLWGKLPLRTDQFAAFAAAYGVTQADLARALGLLDDDVDPALRSRVAAAVGPSFASRAPETVEYAAKVLGKHTQDVQDAIVDQMSAR